LHRRPTASILSVSSEFFEAVCSVGPREEVNASVVFEVFDAYENKPGFIDAL
jgi:hypothetical protein